jgi:hypothetical protein
MISVEQPELIVQAIAGLVTGAVAHECPDLFRVFVDLLAYQTSSVLISKEFAISTKYRIHRFDLHMTANRCKSI